MSYFYKLTSIISLCLLSNNLWGIYYVLPTGNEQFNTYSPAGYESINYLSGNYSLNKDFGEINVSFYKKAFLIKLNVELYPSQSSKLKLRIEQVEEMISAINPTVNESVISSISKILKDKLENIEASKDVISLSLSIIDMFELNNRILLQFNSRDLNFSSEFTLHKYENFDTQVTGNIKDENSQSQYISFSSRMSNLHYFKSTISYGFNIDKLFPILLRDNNDEDDSDDTSSQENNIANTTTQNTDTTVDESQENLITSNSTESYSNTSENTATTFSLFNTANLLSSASNALLTTSHTSTTIADLSYLKKDDDDFASDPIDTTLSSSTTGEYTMTGNYFGANIFYGNVEIDGNGYSIVNTSGSTSAVISVNSTGSLSLTNVGLTHQMDTTACLVIDNYGTIELLDTVLFYNSQQDGAGGNVWGVVIRLNDNTSITTIQNCGFDTNGLTMTGSYNQYGGAISIKSGASIDTITNSYFTENYIISTSSYGGLISGGAAISNYQGTIETISYCDFNDNYVTHSSYYTFGGAVLNFYASIGDITYSNFTNNTAENTYYYSQGGAICNYNATIDTVTYSTFDGNAAISTYYYSYGGAICNYGSSAYIEEISDTDFISNYAQNSTYRSYGGAIYNSGTIELIENATFEYNYAETGRTSTYVSSFGGAIYNSGTILEINNSTFSYNKATSTSTATTAGGAIYNSSATKLEMTDVVFTGNSADYGGAICNSGSMSLTAIDIDILISENIATGAGSFLYNEGTFDIIAQSGDITISGNVGTYAIYNDSATLNLQTSTSNEIKIYDAIYNNNGEVNIKETSNIELNNTLSFGDLNLDGLLEITTDGSVYSATIAISQTGELTTSANSITGTSTIENSGLIYLNGGTLSNSINATNNITTTTGTINILDASYFNATTGANLMIFNQKDDSTVYTITLDSGISTSFNEIEIYLAEDFDICNNLEIELYNGDTSSIFFSDTSSITVSKGDSVLDSSIYTYEWYNYSDSAGIIISVAVPEPSTYAMIFGALALGLAMYRRRK